MSRAEVIDRRVVVDSCDFRVEVVGEGIPVVLLHGLGASSVLWHRVRDGLAPGYQVVLVDLRGAGETREIDRKELSLETWAGDLAELLGALGIERPVLVGHSLGASVALKYALSRPDDVRALVLIAADANLSNVGPRMLKAAGLIGDVGLPDWIDEHWSKNPPFSAASLAREPELLDEYRSMLLLNDPDDYVRQCLAVAQAEDLSGRLGEVRRPALVIVGGDDDRTLPEHGRALAARLADGRMLEMPDVGHTLPLEASDEVVAAVRSFLDEVLAGAGVLRAETTPRNSTEGPFGHLDVRFVVGAHTGASLIAFGQSTYPSGATHENHRHPNAEEVVMVVEGRGTQIVGDEALDLGPGDICFIPRNAPHRITGVSDEDLVILWAFGGAASIEQAGYVPLPD
ncbi:MAG: alpha/beta fold hydrolase [Actinobacteria bacterium]|nr:MAG: alpha/beta fold hydrolase [Actinomycetota bacterium]